MTEFPRLVSIETTNRCNAKCSFCPNNALARERSTMDQALFEKIVEECRAFPLPAIEPFLNGEPFMDRDIIPRMRHIRERLPKTRLRLYSNGSLLTRARLDQMQDLGIDHLFISLNTLDPAQYKEILGLELDKTLGNLEHLCTRADRRGIARKITVRMTRFEDTPLAAQDAFVAFCRKLDVKPMIVGLFNYKGDIPSSLPVPKYPCEHITRLDVLANGNTTLCCLDQEGEYGWGDVRDHSVLEVFNGELARKYKDGQRSGRRLQTPPCDQCNLFWPSYAHMSPGRTIAVLAQSAAYFLKHRPSGRRAPTQQKA
jgi:MoaA/NifB/PqqE/SkfB family radical SAM enzyme